MNETRELRAPATPIWKAAMPLTRRLQRFTLPAALGTLCLVLALLATLQYRWAGELSEAERTRLRAWAKARAEAFARDFDRELTRAFVELQPDADALQRRDLSGYASRFEGWRRGAAHPALVSAVFLIEGDGAGPRLSRFEASRRAFEPIPWPPRLDALRERADALAHAVASPAAPGHGRVPPGPPPEPPRAWPLDLIVEAVPALLIPAPLVSVRRFEPAAGAPGPRVEIDARPLSRLIAVVLDRNYLVRGLLPALAERHFGVGEPGYNLVVERREDRSVVWRSNAAAPLPGSGDAAVELLELRFEETMHELGAGPGAATARLGARAGPDVVSFGATVAGPVRGAAVAGAVFARRFGPGPARVAGGRWRLVAAHPAGSVEEVVAASRVRNLTVSFGILVLLGASAALVAVSAQRAARLAARQVEFVAGVSHELRTPVAVICSAAENLADGVVAGADVRRYGAMLRDEARRLAQMVEQVLEFAGTASRRRTPRRDPLDLTRLLERVLERHARDARERAVRVVREVAPALPPLLGDAEALERAVDNLVGNALKHAADGGSLRVAAGTEPDGVWIAVGDRGRGIPADELPHLFEPFYRGRGTSTSQVRGFGLGLALARRGVEDNGGRIDVASAPGRGSVFTIHLPAGAPAPGSEPAADGVAHPAG
jgi:signal transduction histidine kinase